LGVMQKYTKLIAGLGAILVGSTAILSACSRIQDAPAPGVRTFTPDPKRPSATASRTLPPATLTLTASPSATATRTGTATPSPTSTASPQPTYLILRGEVNAEQVSCFYGPSRAYLFKYLLIGGSVLEIIGILPDTQYIQVRAIGGTNPCWMNLEWMDVRGDVEMLQQIYPKDILLPASPYYGPLTTVSAVREGSQVTISWDPLFLRAGDDSLQEPYLVETWICQDGHLTFIPIGAYVTLANVTDEPGCTEQSHGRVYGVEKHGYTRYVVVPWPEFNP